MGATTVVNRVERITFNYPPLPEIKFCFAVVAVTLAYGLYKVLEASRNYVWIMGDYGVLVELPFFGPVMKDVSSWEWNNYSPFAWQYLPVFIAHTVVFNLGSKFLPDLPFTIGYTLLSAATCVYYFTPTLVALSLFEGTLMFAASQYFKKKVFIWLASLPLLHIIMHHSLMLADNPFLIYTFVSYSMLSYVSYCMDTIEKPVRKEDNTVAKRYLRMLFYTFYQPYLFSLIVLYSDFERQIAERKQKPRDLLGSLWFALRIAFWWGVLELAVHFMYHETILRNIEYSEALSKDTYFALGLTLGIFFHLKYVIIFGLPSVFARFDNMDPQPGPICISRVMLFSKVWREFDRGLYQFFKTYIFVPICAPTFSLPRKIFGVFVSYSFVLLWHGFYHHNIVWIILNIISLLLEMSSKALYGVESFRLWREKVISDVNFRRVLALFQIVPFAFGLYSNIYFLGGSEVGALFVKRIFDEETIPLRGFVLMLFTLGWFNANVSMEVDRWNELRRKKDSEKKKLSSKRND
uniref:Protein-cysteine N-palmitoyltransferase Rasp n=2 Tax=Haemonchus contortus TaxID=6289 RepID=A0A7I4Z5I9_HAECO|nr:Membrane bound O-acyl transferase domain containing protein [Haemonchus contortus]